MMNSNSKAFEWREHTGKTLIGLLLTGLGTLVFISGSYLVTFEDRFNIAFPKYEATMKMDSRRMSRSLEFMTSITKALQRSGERLDRYTRYLNLPQKDHSAEESHRLMDKILAETADDLANLTGYTPETTGLPAKYHESVTTVFRDELEYWRSVNSLTPKLTQDKPISQEKVAESQRKSAELRYANAVLRSSNEDAKVARELNQMSIDEASVEIKSIVRDMRKWSRLAVPVFFISTFAFYVALTFTLRKKAQNDSTSQNTITPVANEDTNNQQ